MNDEFQKTDLGQALADVQHRLGQAKELAAQYVTRGQRFAAKVGRVSGQIQELSRQIKGLCRQMEDRVAELEGGKANA
jgi:hypothetical protein